jgi:glycine oxidase
MMALESYNMFPDLVSSLEQETGMDLLYQRRPSLRLALDTEEERLIEDLRVWQSEVRPTRWIDGDEVRRLEPRLSPNIRRALYEDESAQLDSYRLTLALGRAAEAHGAELHLRRVTGLRARGGRVTGVASTGGDFSCGAVVLAAGAWSSQFSSHLGFRIPVRPLKGERLLLKYAGDPLPFLISSPKRGHMISRLDGLLSVGSTGGRDYDKQELFLGVEFDRVPSEAAKLELLQRAIDVFPGVESAQLVQQLAGSRPLSPDRMPIIGPVPGWEGVMLATGHATKGIHLAPITGKVIADYILRGKTDVSADMDAFLPSRFTGSETHDYQSAGERVEE